MRFISEQDTILEAADGIMNVVSGVVLAMRLLVVWRLCLGCFESLSALLMQKSGLDSAMGSMYTLSFCMLYGSLAARLVGCGEHGTELAV